MILWQGLESKRAVDWSRILLIRVTFESPRRSTKCLFPLIRKAAAMVRFSSPRSTHKDSILHYKAVKVTINTPDFAEVIFDHGFLDSVVTNSGSLYPLGTCRCCAIFQMLDAAILPRSNKVFDFFK